jgi:ATP-dependent helicase HrpA
MINQIRIQPDLPICTEQERIIEALQKHRVIIVAGDTGSGKTTQLPKMCLAAGLGRQRLIGCTQPRRLAATSVAARVRQELGEAEAHLVGYKIRFQDRTGKTTRIKFMTDGILLAEAQTDPLLRAYETIIVDEAHERSLNIDFLLGMLQRLLTRRDDLKVIITSATIDTGKFSRNFNNAPIIEVSGRTYPVEVRYRPPAVTEGEEESSYVDRAVEAVLELRRERAGDVLVFMPTERDIRETVESLTDAWQTRRDPSVWSRKPLVLPLFGRLTAADQNRIFAPHPGQKIVVATNVAETSVTVPGIRYVVDTGLARISTYNLRARTTKLPVVPVSRASADQRQGRCGRIGPGVCIRLYAEDDYQGRPEFTPPEVLRSNLAEVILRMISLGLGEPADFPFIDPPSPRALRDGFSHLRELGALDAANRITGRGRLMARLPLDPAIARMIIEARDRNCLKEMTVIAAALSIQDPRVRPADKEAEADAVHARFQVPGSDFLFYFKLWDTLYPLAQTGSKSRLRKFCSTHYFSFQRLREWLDVHEQIWSILEEENSPAACKRGGHPFLANEAPADLDAVHQAILSGNLRNIGCKKEKNLFQGGGGKELVVFPGSGLYNRAGQWVMAAELVETTNLYARTVANIKPEWIEPLAGDLCRYSYSSPHWEKKRGQVVATEKVTLFGLVLVADRKVNFGRLQPTEARQIFIDSALVAGELNGSYGFLQANQALLARLQEVEDRMRQRDLVVDETALSRFYDERLPAEVWDQASLHRFLRRQDGDRILRMREEDILLRSPAAAQLDKFPEQFPFGEFSLELSYKFQPGTEEDGVTVILPANLLSQITQAPFEWLVPGLLPEKILLLLKGLPKGLRKQLVPIPATAEALLAGLAAGHGSLYHALEQLLAERFGLQVHRRHWQVDSLPTHLRMRFCLVDHSGATLKTTRDFDQLSLADVPRNGTDHLATLRQKWEREGITNWDFAGLPERITIDAGNGRFTGFAYPGLAAGADTATLKLYDTEEESRRVTREGLLVLYRHQFPQLFKNIKKDFALPRADWALCEGIDTQENFNRRLLLAILTELFGTRQGRIPSREQFTERVARIKAQGLYAPGQRILENIRGALQERRQTLAHILHFEQLAGGGQERFALYRRQVEQILPSSFLDDFEKEWLPAAIRYFKCLRLRVERGHAAPAKEMAKSALVLPHEQRLHDFIARGADRQPECKQLIAEYRQMIEEFKISLFAQELKTIFPISEKRLEEKWQEVARIS